MYHKHYYFSKVLHHIRSIIFVHQFFLPSECETQKQEINNFDPRVDSIYYKTVSPSQLLTIHLRMSSPPQKSHWEKKLLRQSAAFTTELQSSNEF